MTAIYLISLYMLVDQKQLSNWHNCTQTYHFLGFHSHFKIVLDCDGNKVSLVQWVAGHFRASVFL